MSKQPRREEIERTKQLAWDRVMQSITTTREETKKYINIVVKTESPNKIKKGEEKVLVKVEDDSDEDLDFDDVFDDSDDDQEEEGEAEGEEEEENKGEEEKSVTAHKVKSTVTKVNAAAMMPTDDDDDFGLSTHYMNFKMQQKVQSSPSSPMCGVTEQGDCLNLFEDSDMCI